MTTLLTSLGGVLLAVLLLIAPVGVWAIRNRDHVRTLLVPIAAVVSHIAGTCNLDTCPCGPTPSLPAYQEPVTVEELAGLPDPDCEPADYAGCTYCLGGFSPAGTHPILGLVYTACTHCGEACQCCDTTGLFPADTTCPHCLNEALAVLGMTAEFCHTCAGVLAVRPTLEVMP
jgi:hypothetical protein